MSVRDVVTLVGHIDAFNQRMLDDYSQRLVDNNINGAVLMSCNLAELKPVLQMAFGDWVLFQSLVESLRYSEQSGEQCAGEASSPMEVFVQSHEYNTSNVGAKNTSASTTVAVINSVTSSSKKATSDVALTSASNTDVSAGPSRSSPTLKDLPTAGDLDVTDDVKTTVSSSPKSFHPLTRQDSFVSEVLMESEALRGFIQASVVGSDSEGGSLASDDEVDRPITTIPEEPPVVSRNTSASSLGRMSTRQMSIARRMSTESGPLDRAFSVGPDQDSGESDSEVERVSRKSSIRQSSATLGGAVTKTENDATPGSSASEDRRKKATSKSTKNVHDSHRTSQKFADRSKSASKLEKGANESSVPLMSYYFPMAYDRSDAGSQTTSYVSPKTSGTAVSISSRHADSSATANESECSVAVVGLSSRQHETASSSSDSRQHPTSSAATRVPSSASTNHATPSQQISQSIESAESAASDQVKFFIVDERDTSPKAIMVEMDDLPLRRVGSSINSDQSSPHGTDQCIL